MKLANEFLKNTDMFFKKNNVQKLKFLKSFDAPILDNFWQSFLHLFFDCNLGKSVN